MHTGREAVDASIPVLNRPVGRLRSRAVRRTTNHSAVPLHGDVESDGPRSAGSGAIVCWLRYSSSPFSVAGAKFRYASEVSIGNCEVSTRGYWAGA
jgi:hypothetical protein